MKRGYKRLLVFETIIILLLILNSFVSSILTGYIKVLFLLGILVVFKMFFGFEKDRHRYWKSICIEVLIFLLLYFILYYLSGLVLSFAKTNNYYSFKGIFNVIIPLILTIILKEILRYMMLTKSEGSKLLIFITTVLFILLDVSLALKIDSLTSNYEIFIFTAITVLPTISSNILCSYMTYKSGYKPTILYLLITTLYSYLLPIIPNPNQYLYSIVQLIMPFILLYRIYLFYKKDRDEEILREYNKKRLGTLILPLIVVIILVYFTSGYFYHHAIVIASGSMTPKILKGDVVVIEKIPNKKDIEVGEVIAYRYNKIIVVHRLVKKIKVDGEYIYYSKGDANNDIDNYKITEDMIIGVVNVKIPYIGYPTVWLNNL